jgi:ribosomal protein L37AE/L43A
MHPYTGIRIAMPTKHGKASVIKKAFNQCFPVEIIEVDADTDLLGTFAGEVERIDPPLETAIKKHELVTGYEYTITSEGSIGSDPSIPFLISDYEILVFKDHKRNLLIKEAHRSFEIKAVKQEIFLGEDIDEILKQSDFPNHSLIVKAPEVAKISPFKGLKNINDVNKAIEKVAKVSKKIVIESDLRANHSPSRMENIYVTAQKLAKRINNLCSACHTPGFGVKRYEKGVNCSHCKRLNLDVVKAEILGCVNCDLEFLGEEVNKEIAPDKCIWCNP